MLLTRKGTAASSQAIAADCHLSIAAEIRRFVAAGTRQILVTSSGPGEGKSSVVSEVGRALARQPELRVVLVDTDQLRPSLHRMFETGPAGGLGELIQQTYELDLRGKLPADFGLGDWIELLQVQGRTGRLEVVAEGGALVLTFVKGAIASITDRSASAERRLGGLLTESGHLTTARRDQALQMAEASGEPLGEIALRLGFVEAGPLQAALRGQFGERLQQMLTMRQPRCAFSEATERELGAAVTRDAAAAAGWATQSGAMLMIREHLKRPYLERQLNAALKDTEVPNLKIMPSGRGYVNLLEGSAPAALRCVLEHLASTHDVVLVDSPPVALGSPAEAISEMVGGTILVVQADRFEAAVINRAKDRLEQRGARVLGVILNQVDLQQPDQSFHYYYLYYPAGGDGNGTPRSGRSRRRAAAAARDLPPALRTRLEKEAELEPIGIRLASSGRLLAVALVLILALVSFFAIRFGPWSQRREVATAAGRSASVSAAGAASAALAPASPALGDSSAMAQVAPAKSSAAARTRPPAPTASAATTAASRAGQAHAAPKPDRASTTLFTISVGTFLESDRANVERRKLLSITSYTSRVLKISESGEESYRVVVGTFASRAAAEKAASDLMGTGRVREAMVLPAAGAAAN